MDDDCRSCGGSGEILIKQCPQELLPRGIHEFVKLARFADKGHLPVSGGVIDQTRSFSDSLGFFQSEEARWKARRSGH